MREGAASHGWTLGGGIVIFELLPPESLLDSEQQQSLLYSSDLELGETTKQIFEAVDRARAFVVERAGEREQPVPDDLEHVAHVIGIGGVKYADLSQNRMSNYVFSFDKMLSLRGNTAPYLQYAYVRMRSILREAGWADGPPAAPSVALVEPAEVELAKVLVATRDVFERVAGEHAPNHLCAHLFDLSQAYNQFYEHCPVLRAEEPVRTSRLALCDATARTLSMGLAVLGIGVLERI